VKYLTSRADVTVEPVIIRRTKPPISAGKIDRFVAERVSGRAFA
jgi:hypothetical protein